ncbi:MAG: glycosyltransferase family 2 protein [Candidatus Micrarchaeota archaeon]|nr:glycosyltransferase family 2 protein [Candidatus Micrarchaeota archaeon]
MHGKDRISVIMPVYNEERTLRSIIERVLAQGMVDSLIIIDDHSGDSSLDIIKDMAKSDKRIAYLSNGNNMGKGYSVRRGLKLVKEGIIIIQDADLEYYPEDYGILVPEVGDGTAVLGTRIHGKKTGHEYILAKFANDVFTRELNVLYGTHLTDINTCYKIFKRSMVSDSELKEDGFLIDPEILLTIIRKGYRIKEVNIRYSGRTYKEGKKINAKDAFDQALFIFRRRLTG